MELRVPIWLVGVLSGFLADAFVRSGKWAVGVAVLVFFGSFIYGAVKERT